MNQDDVVKRLLVKYCVVKRVRKSYSFPCYNISIHALCILNRNIIFLVFTVLTCVIMSLAALEKLLVSCAGKHATGDEVYLVFALTLSGFSLCYSLSRLAVILFSL